MKKFVDDNRPQLGWVVALLVVFLVGLTASSFNADSRSLSALSDVEQDQIRSHAQAILDILDATTTTQATTTTGPTTTAPTTTGPTTTVTQPTTTTAPQGIPETIIHPGISSGNGYRIGVTDLDTNTLMWSAPYHHELLYQAFTGWRNGDRIAYHCAYGFLTDHGAIVGRFTFRAVPTDLNNPNGAYIRINDTFMEDSPVDPQDTAGGPNRRYNGEVRVPNIQSPFEDCPQNVGVAYEEGNFPDEDPVIPFWNDGRVIEIRDYRNVVPAAGVTFQELPPITEPFQVTTGRGTADDPFKTHTVNDRRSVLARLNGVPFAVVYYDGLGTGSMFPPHPPPTTTTTTPATTTTQPTTTTTATTTTGSNPADCNVVVSMSQGRQVYNGSNAGNPPASPLEAATGEEWMMLFRSGRTLEWWTTAANWNGLAEFHRCGTDAEIDRIVFIFDPFGSGANGDDGATMITHLNQVVDITGSRYPNAVTDLVMLVGAEGHVACSPSVRAAQTHAARIGQLNTHPNAGVDIDIPCSGYADGLGHLTNSGAASALAQLAAS